MDAAIANYNADQSPEHRSICDTLAGEIPRGLPQAKGKVWHGGPVWFLNGNPVAGYWVRKKGVQLLFWSGQSFDEPGLNSEGKFKAAEKYYGSVDQIEVGALQGWLKKAVSIQWDYKNIVKRKGRLEKIGDW